MRFKKFFGLIVGGIMLCSIALAGCDATNSNGNNNDGNNTGEEITVAVIDNDGNNTDEEITVAGIDKKDIFTWFDMNKTDLPSLEKCKKIKAGMSLNQVISEIGKPQREIGYGAFLFQFDLDNGSVFTITFVHDVYKIENKPDISNYDSLIVAYMDFEREIPDIFFPYCGSFNELYSWVDNLNVEDIVQVRYEHAFIGVAPGSLKDISYTTNSVDIENCYRLLFSNVQQISEDEGLVDGGGYVKYDFVTANNETYSVMVCNNRLFINGRYYRFVGNFYYEFQYADIECYAFDTNNWDEYEIYTYATESIKVGDYDGLGEFEFCIYDGLIEKAPSYYAKTKLNLNLLILSSNQFMIEDDYKSIVYQIISEKDFSTLFEYDNE